MPHSNFISILLISPFIALLFVLLLYWYVQLFKYRNLRKIPGPKPFPIIGNAYLFKNSPPHLLQTIMNLQKEYGNIFKVWIGPELNLIISKPEYLEQLLNSNENISKSRGYQMLSPWLGDGLLISTGAKWKSRRKMITPTFHFKVLDNFMEVFNRQSDIMVERVMETIRENPGESINIFNFVNLMSLDSICETSFGVSIHAQKNQNNQYVAAIATCTRILIYRFFSPWLSNSLIFRLSKYYEPFRQTVKILHEFSEDVIMKRKTEFDRSIKTHIVNDDGIRVKKAFLDMLLEANQHNHILSDRDLRDEVNTFLFEGHDTTTAALTFTLYELAKNPDIQQKLYKELSDYLGKDSTIPLTLSDLNSLKYLDNVFKEGLRMYPSVPMIERCLDKEWIVDGLRVPRHTRIGINVFGVGRDPVLFPNPEKFNPDRFLPENQVGRHNYAYVPFSAGPRNCIGQRHATFSAKTAIVKFVLKYQLEVDPKASLPEIGLCIVLKSMNGIHIKVTPRN